MNCHKIISSITAVTVGLSSFALSAFASETADISVTDFGAQIYGMGSTSWSWAYVDSAFSEDGTLSFTVDPTTLNPKGDSKIGDVGLQFYLSESGRDLLGTDSVKATADYTIRTATDEVKSGTVAIDFDDTTYSAEVSIFGYGTDWSVLTDLGELTVEATLKIVDSDEDTDTTANTKTKTKTKTKTTVLSESSNTYTFTGIQDQRSDAVIVNETMFAWSEFSKYGTLDLTADISDIVSELNISPEDITVSLYGIGTTNWNRNEQIINFGSDGKAEIMLDVLELNPEEDADVFIGIEFTVNHYDLEFGDTVTAHINYTLTSTTSADDLADTKVDISPTDFGAQIYGMGSTCWNWTSSDSKFSEDGTLSITVDPTTLNPSGDSEIGGAGIQFYLDSSVFNEFDTDSVNATINYTITTGNLGEYESRKISATFDSDSPYSIVTLFSYGTDWEDFYDLGYITLEATIKIGDSDEDKESEVDYYLPQTIDTSNQTYSDWGSQGEVNYEYFKNITPDTDMKVTVKYNIRGNDSYHLLKPMCLDFWENLKNYISGIELRDDLTDDEIKDREENGGAPVIQSDGYIILYGSGEGELTFTISAEGVKYLLEDAEDEGYGGLGFQSYDVEISEVTLEESEVDYYLPQTIDTSDQTYSDWSSQGSVDYKYFKNITPDTDMKVTVKYNVLGNESYHLFKPMNLNGWGSLKNYISGIELRDDLTEDEYNDRCDYGGDPVLYDDGFIVVFDEGEGEITFTISAEGVQQLLEDAENEGYGGLGFQSCDITISEVKLEEVINCPDCDCTSVNCENWNDTLAKCDNGCSSDEEDSICICSVCHAVHDYVAVESVEKTCTEDGYTDYECSICGDSYTEEFIATGHTEVADKAVEATCTEDGKTAGSHCSVCGEILTAQKILPATGHDYNSGKTTTVATCSTDGIKTYTCKTCGDSYTVVLPALGHDYNNGRITKNPTCTEAGVKTFTCSDCGDSYTTEIRATGHTEVTDNAVAATCTTDGKTEGSHCSVCGEVLTAQTTVKAKGHSYASKITKAATCTEDGVKTFTCTVCDDTYTETVKATGHTLVTDKAVAATCTAAGKTQGTHCSVCGEVITAQKSVKAKGHTYDSGKITTAATCTADGVKTYTCTVCKATKTETVSKTGHSYTATKTVKPTTTAQGYTLNTCSSCGKTTKTNYTAKLIAMSKVKVSGVKSTYAYTGKSIAPTVTVKYGSTKLTKGTDYTVSYKNNTKTGKATVTITGKGKYSGTVTKTFTIVPKKATVSSVKSSKTKTVTVKWAKDTQATGYEVLYSTSSNFGSAKKITVTKNSTVTKTISSLTKGKTYYVKVRAYKTISGKKYYGAYSAVKSVKCK